MLKLLNTLSDLLVPEWRRIIAISYSWWLELIGLMVLFTADRIAASGVTELNPYIIGHAGFALAVLSLIGRLVKQPDGVVANWVRIAFLVTLALAFGATMGRPSPLHMIWRWDRPPRWIAPRLPRRPRSQRPIRFS